MLLNSPLIKEEKENQNFELKDNENTYQNLWSILLDLNGQIDRKISFYLLIINKT